MDIHKLRDFQENKRGKKKKFSPTRTAQHWSRMLKEVENLQGWVWHKTQLDKALRNLV